MRKTLIIFLCIMLACRLAAQIVVPGIPYSFMFDTYPVKEVPFCTMPSFDVSALIREDEINDLTSSIPWRFGENFLVDINIKNSGKFQLTEDGNKLWHLGITSRGALSLNLTFSRYYLPQGASLFIYSPDKKTVLGAFTNLNNQKDNVFATTLIPGDSIIIEYSEPAAALFSGELHLSRVTHAYRNAYDHIKSFGSAGSCNNNVACATGWDNEIRSVCMLVVGGNGFCTGSLINNTAQDGKPYILTANHCSSSNDFGSWVFWFNWQSPSCSNPPGSPPYNSISGSALKARNAASDFCLVEMSSPPTIDFLAYYEGWDNSGVQPDSQICIHHPSGDIKKISFDYEPAVAANWSSAACWQITAWNSGTTEGGSSGSPLYNENHHVIGQLYGGTASCSQPNESDYFGRFAVSWATGTTPETRLKDWLDPLNTGDSVLNGHDFNTAIYTTDISLYSILSPPAGTVCQTGINPSITIRNYGSDTLRTLRVYYGLDGNTPSFSDWTGALAYLNSRTIDLPAMNPTPGNHILRVFISQPNGGTDQNHSNDTLEVAFNLMDGKAVTLFLETDPKPSETSWRIYNINHEIVYSNPTLSALSSTTEEYCLSEGCYDFVIYDSGGDGLNGYFGFLQGSYRLSFNGTVIMQASGNFGSMDSVRFCTDSLHYIRENNDREFNMYPNPGNGIFTIETKEPDNHTWCTIYDLYGKVIYRQQIAGQKDVIDLRNAGSGTYIAELTSGRKSVVKKICILKN